MTCLVDKNTQICCSFAKVAGSRGCFVHNSAFQHLGLNYIYKSFSVDNIEKAIDAMKTLNIRGAAITMPYKIKALQYIDSIDPVAEKIGSINTILHEESGLHGCNTDYLAILAMCSKFLRKKSVYILGSGGMARAACQAVVDLGFKTPAFITRNEWGEISKLDECVVVNCTPIEVSLHPSNDFIDCSVNSATGKEIALLQASWQFELYTGQNFPMNYIRELLKNKIDL